MSLNENSEAILLLTAHFSPAKRGVPNPLTPTEYGRLARWLHENQYQPEEFFSDFQTLGQEWDDPKGKITPDRLKHLFGRGMAMGLALEKWHSAGIWITTRADPAYPARLREKLRNVAPPVIFGVGNKQLLNAGGIAIVGSRSIETSDTTYARQIAESASNEAMNVVSGGAKGVDEISMLAALEVEGTALGILANGLMSSALSGKWRSHITNRQLCLASTYYPEAPFHVGNAMGRNKYIYCLADYGLIVRSDKDKGGTWAGATEALKKNLAPVFVKPNSDATGNGALVELGATPLHLPSTDVASRDTWLKHALEESHDHDANLQPHSPAETRERQQQLGLFDK
jgi:predicted Rossmann fold nucleotide-binding protein DprA/Smf involved in DNA uptake